MLAYKLLVVVVVMASIEWIEKDFENFLSLIEEVVACRETTEEDVADFCLKEVVGNFATNSYKLTN